MRLKTVMMCAEEEARMDDTLDDIETWLETYSYAHSRGRLGLDDVMSAYVQATGVTVSAEDALAALSTRYEAARDERGALIFRAVLEI